MRVASRSFDRSPVTLFAGIALSAAATLAGCGQPTASSETKNIFGPDNRQTVPSGTPYDAIGRLDSGCTGTLIGKRLVLTAAHCILDSATGTVKPEVLYFRPSLRDGESSRPAWIDYAWLGTLQPETDRVRDWAIIRLTEAVGEQFGHVGIHPVDVAASLPFTTSLAGYSLDRSNGDEASVHRGCYIHEVVDGRYYHDCDATAGISGGPLFSKVNGNDYVIGISVSEFRRGASGSVTRDGYSADYANVGIPASGFASVATTLLQTADVGIAAPTIPGVIEKTNPNVRTDPTPGQGSSPIYVADDVIDQRLLTQQSRALRQAVDALRLESQRLTSLAEGIRSRTLIDRAFDLKGAVDALDTAIGRVVTGRVVVGYREHLYGYYNAAKAMENRMQRVDMSRGRPADVQALTRALGEFARAFEAVEALVFGSVTQ